MSETFYSTALQLHARARAQAIKQPPAGSPSFPESAEQLCCLQAEAARDQIQPVKDPKNVPEALDSVGDATENSVPDPDPKATNTALTQSPSLPASTDAAQHEAQGAVPGTGFLGGATAARHYLLSAFLVQPAYAGQASTPPPSCSLTCSLADTLPLPAESMHSPGHTSPPPPPPPPPPPRSPLISLKASPTAITF